MDALISSFPLSSWKSYESHKYVENKNFNFVKIKRETTKYTKAADTLGFTR